MFRFNKRGRREIFQLYLEILFKTDPKTPKDLYTTLPKNIINLIKEVQ